MVHVSDVGQFAAETYFMGGSVTFFSVWWVSRRLRIQVFGALFRSPCFGEHRGGCEEVLGILGVAVGEIIKICGSDTERSHSFCIREDINIYTAE